jgi:CheY-like chemotaxis protein
MGINCFLVDDSTLFLETASELLEAQGMAVIGVATTSAEALARVPELEPDVTIVDVDLNGESGFDLVWQRSERRGCLEENDHHLDAQRVGYGRARRRDPRARVHRQERVFRGADQSFSR